MSSSRLGTALGLLAIVPALAAAQVRPATPPPAAPRPAATPAQRPPAAARPRMGAFRDRSWQFGIQGGIMYLDQVLNAALIGGGTPIKTSAERIMPGGAVYLARQFGPNFSFGLGTGVFTGGGALALTPRLNLTLSTNINNSAVFFIPLGAGITRISGNGDRMTSIYGVHGGLGVMKFLNNGNTALRIEGRMSMDKFDELTKNVFNAQGLAGLTFVFGGGPPPDADMDGVTDRRDACAATPRGAVVDVRGCPRDSDGDRVWDGLDRCAATPANTPVDASGCTRDSDADGVNDTADRCAATPAGTRVDATGCPLDTDGDGVADAADRCANTARGTPVDANGCVRDSDSDTVNDTADRCPGTPAGTAVDANGCPRDADGDGVSDATDRCSGTPAGTRVDATGCPLNPDADRDGVADSADRCANTPTGRMVDANGCPLAELPEVGRSLVIRNVNFVTGGANLTAASAAPLRALAISIQAILRQSPNARFEVGGYTDSRGSVASNRALSDRRAQTVKSAMQAAGVPESALVGVGYGPDNPIAPNTTVAGRTQNRRVEIKRLM